MEHILTLIIGLAAGGTILFFLMRARLKSTADIARAEQEQACAVLNERLSSQTVAVEKLSEELEALKKLHEELRTEKEANGLKLAAAESAHLEMLKNEQAKARTLEQYEKRIELKDQEYRELSDRNSSLKSHISELETLLEEERKQTAEKLQLLEEAKTRLSDQFKNLANEILEKNSAKLNEQNHEKLAGILNPLGEKMKEFEKKVEETYVKGAKEHSSLIEQIKSLQKLNQQLSKGAEDLTNALKGDSKTQGNWGELVLERILENSGLQKGREYFTQVSHSTDDGRYQPDVIINLPDKKNIVIDAKVSLTAYERYCSESDPEEQAKALKEHINSLKRHIKELGEKNYQDLPGIKSVDFVLLFIPVEPAFGLAVRTETDLFFTASKSNIVMVTPSTLLATLRTVSHIWRQEDQSRNATEIARLSGELYNKFTGFVNDLDNIGSRLEQTRKAYDAAHNKLSSGRGNLIITAEKIKTLGARTNKSLPDDILEDAGVEIPSSPPEDRLLQ